MADLQKKKRRGAGLAHINLIYTYEEAAVHSCESQIRIKYCTDRLIVVPETLDQLGYRSASPARKKEKKKIETYAEVKRWDKVNDYLSVDRPILFQQ